MQYYTSWYEVIYELIIFRGGSFWFCFAFLIIWRNLRITVWLELWGQVHSLNLKNRTGDSLKNKLFIVQCPSQKWSFTIIIKNWSRTKVSLLRDNTFTLFPNARLCWVSRPDCAADRFRSLSTMPSFVYFVEMLNCCWIIVGSSMLIKLFKFYGVVVWISSISDSWKLATLVPSRHSDVMIVEQTSHDNYR